MQAGLASKPLTWHDIFTARHIGVCLLVAVVRVSVTVSTGLGVAEMASRNQRAAA